VTTPGPAVDPGRHTLNNLTLPSRCGLRQCSGMTQERVPAGAFPDVQPYPCKDREVSRFLTLLAAGVAACAGAAPLGAARASALQRFFQTPSGNIACEVDEDAAVGSFAGRRTLFCVVFSASSSGRGQRTWLMTTTGRAHVTWIVANIATETPTLAYGRSWSFKGFSCRSRRVGLTCSNRSGHGFFLSRQHQRIF
jgi:hypothetical protein